LGIGAVAGIFGVGQCRRPNLAPVPATIPLPPPRDSFDTQSILAYINSITLSGRNFNELVVDNTTTTEGQAIQWLIHDDRRTLAADKLALRQRYALTALWFQQPVNASSFSSSSSSILPIDNGNDDDRMAHASTWANTNYHECQWRHVYCDSSDRVIGLNLPDNLIMGRIPDDLALLTVLQQLQLKGNALTGPISSTLGRLSALTVLTLSDSRLTGGMTSFLANLTLMNQHRFSATTTRSEKRQPHSLLYLIVNAAALQRRRLGNSTVHAGKWRKSGPPSLSLPKCKRGNLEKERNYSILFGRDITRELLVHRIVRTTWLSLLHGLDAYVYMDARPSVKTPWPRSF
jgi:hypothetical protein